MKIREFEPNCDDDFIDFIPCDVYALLKNIILESDGNCLILLKVVFTTLVPCFPCREPTRCTMELCAASFGAVYELFAKKLLPLRDMKHVTSELDGSLLGDRTIDRTTGTSFPKSMFAATGTIYSRGQHVIRMRLPQSLWSYHFLRVIGTTGILQSFLGVLHHANLVH
ncbi:hypothetical protein AC579_8280 [Pseudocercospora musae]|uniref:Uncharacterized protein n=1 Tax=Pseudocercospora musae TaxID=113226 RepID=A0A139I2A3_9PEZI|nr:hypothetical protein AC579_8280 [Pseudocercospora musae]